MISHPVAGAVQTLQKQALTSRDNYELDRIERALDELLRNPTDTDTPAQHRVRSARGHAYEVLERRRGLAPCVPLDQESADRGHPDSSYLIVDILVWLRGEPGLATGERHLLNDLARGHDAAAIAERDNVPLPRVRERISRARRRAKVLWQAVEAAA